MSFEQDLQKAHKARHAKFFPPKAAPKPTPKFKPPTLPIHKRGVTTIAVTDSDEPSPLVVKTFTADWRPTIREIRFAVCQHFNITSLELDRRSRTKDVSRRRQIAMYLCVKLTHYSQPHIARQFGTFDHSTIIHAYRRIQSLRAMSLKFDEEIQSLEQQIMKVVP